MKKKLMVIFSLFMMFMPFNTVFAADAFKFCDVSQNPEVMAGFKLGAIVILIVKILVPIILIIMGMIDMSKAVVDSNQDAIKKNAIVFGKRAVAAILVFFVPTIILNLFELIGKYSDTGEFAPCMECLLDISKCPSNAKIGSK